MGKNIKTSRPIQFCLKKSNFILLKCHIWHHHISFSQQEVLTSFYYSRPIAGIIAKIEHETTYLQTFKMAGEELIHALSVVPTKSDSDVISYLQLLKAYIL